MINAEEKYELSKKTDSDWIFQQTTMERNQKTLNNDSFPKYQNLHSIFQRFQKNIHVEKQKTSFQRRIDFNDGFSVIRMTIVCYYKGSYAKYCKT